MIHAMLITFGVLLAIVLFPLLFGIGAGLLHLSLKAIGAVFRFLFIDYFGVLGLAGIVSLVYLPLDIPDHVKGFISVIFAIIIVAGLIRNKIRETNSSSAAEFFSSARRENREAYSFVLAILCGAAVGTFLHNAFKIQSAITTPIGIGIGLVVLGWCFFYIQKEKAEECEKNERIAAKTAKEKAEAERLAAQAEVVRKAQAEKEVERRAIMGKERDEAEAERKARWEQDIKNYERRVARAKAAHST